MPTNPPCGLALIIGRENSETWMERCSKCNGKGYHDLSEDEKNKNKRVPFHLQIKGSKCPACRGSGEVEMFAEGVVGVDWKERLRAAGWSDWLNISHTDIDFRGDKGAAIEKLILRFRANTLPAELLYDPDLQPWGLRKVEVGK